MSLVYAHILAMLGDRTGEDELVAWVQTHGWGDKWTESMDSGVNRMSAYLLALARAGSRKAVPAILDAYANDPRGFYANHARRLLEEVTSGAARDGSPR